MRLELLNRNKGLIDEIARLKHQEFGYLVPGKTVEDFVKGLNSHLNEKGLPITYVLVEKGQFIGTFSLRKWDIASHQQFAPWLASVLVKPEKRNQGIGAFLCEEAEIKAKEMGFRELYLFTPNKEAWYKKLGWKTLEHTHFNQTSVAIMSKHL